MKLTLLGTGCPVPSLRRRGPSQVVECGDDLIMIDCGAGTLHRLLEAGYLGKSLSYILFTHLHSDHVTGLMDVLWAGWIRRKMPVVYGPPGTQHFIEHMIESMAYDARVRGGERGPVRRGPEAFEFEEGWSIEGGDWRLSTFRVDHQPVDQAFGFRIDQGSSSLAVSGDTRPCENLVRHARDVDVLVHEVSLAKGLQPPAGGYRDAAEQQRTELLRNYHTSSEVVGKIATEAGARHLVLSHIYTGRVTEDNPKDFITDVTPHYAGKLTVGEDLMTFDVGA
jgi:ribonuclease Z